MTTGVAATQPESRPSAAWLYLTSAGMSMLGNSIATVVWPWLVLQRTGDPAAAGVVATAIAIPSLLFALIGGQLVDTFGSKRMSVISDVISGASVVAVVLVDTWWGLNMGWLIALGIIGAVGDIPGMSARSALAGDVAYTSGKTIDFISGISQTLIGVTFLLGPAATGMLMSLLPVQQVLWITAGCSFLAALLTALLRLNTNPENPGEEALSLSNWRQGWSAILRHPVIRLFAFFVFISSVLIAPYLILILPAHFQGTDNPRLLGIALSTYAVGMIIGGGLIAKLGTQQRRAIWVISMICFTIGFFCLVLMDTPWVLLTGMAIAGIGGGLSGPLRMVLVTEYIPQQLRGRAFSVFDAMQQFAAPFGFVAATVALTTLSIYTVAAIAAVIWACSALVFIVRGAVLIPPAVNYDDQSEPRPTF